MTALATTSETLAAQTPSGRSIALWALLGFLGSWVFIRTSSRLIRSPKVDWWPGSVKTSGGLHIRPPGLGHRVADRLRFAKTVAGMDRMLGDSGQRARARRPRAARSAATRRRQRL